MIVGKDEIRQAFFQDPGFEQTWMDMKQEYETLGFRDKITDDEIIAEFKYIAQQLRKYKFSKQDQILSHDSIDEMIDEIRELIGKAPEYGDTRKEIVYNFLRDHWLINMHNALVQVIQMTDEEDEDA